MPGLAVVLSGGGAKGAFQVGVLDALITERGVSFDTFVGTSTGAIQALGGAMDDMPGLLAEWQKLKSNDDVYKDGGGILGGVLGNPSLYNATPIRNRIKAYADEVKLKATGKKLRIGVVSLQTGLFRTINENVPGIANWVYASCAMPVFFGPFVTQDAAGKKEQWVDGGVREVTPLNAAMLENPRAILIVGTSPAKKTASDPKNYGNLIKIGTRAAAIQQSEVSANDAANADLYASLLDARARQSAALTAAGVTGAAAAKILRPLDETIAANRIVPIRVLLPDESPSETLEFDPAKIAAAIAAGRKAVADNWTAKLKLKDFLSA